MAEVSWTKQHAGLCPPFFCLLKAICGEVWRLQKPGCLSVTFLFGSMLQVFCWTLVPRKLGNENLLFHVLGSRTMMMFFVHFSPRFSFGREAVNAAYMDRCDLSAHGFYATPGISPLTSEKRAGGLVFVGRKILVSKDSFLGGIFFSAERIHGMIGIFTIKINHSCR